VSQITEQDYGVSNISLKKYRVYLQIKSPEIQGVPQDKSPEVQGELLDKKPEIQGFQD